MDQMARQRTDRGAADDDLIRRVVDGDATAWTALVDRHAAPLTAFAWHMLGDRAEAEDVTQEAFLRLFRKTATWQPGGALLRTWLTRVANNLCIDRIRSRRVMALDIVDPEDLALDGEEPLQIRLDRERALGAAMAGLPPRQRGAIVLVHYQGFSQREAADSLGVTVEALESLLARARRSLRQALAPLLGDLLDNHRTGAARGGET